MFFISWGSRVFQIFFGERENHYCDVCREERSFRKLITYRIFHILWIFRFITEKSYARICEICRNGPRLAARDVEGKWEKSPIRFIDRFGWLIGLGMVAAFGVFVVISDRVSAAHDVAWLAQPAVNDLYEVDLAKMETKPEKPVMYSSVLVTQVSADAVQVRMPNGYYDKLEGVLEDISSGKARASTYYSDQTVVLPRTALARLKADRVILAVKR